MNKTQIEWVKNPDGSQGYTFNPITGCLNHENGLCKGGDFPCYAYKLANGRLKQRYLVNEHLAPVIGACRANEGKPVGIAQLDPFYPRFWEERLYHAWDGKPRGIFVCDMGDLFGIGIPEEWTNKVLNLCRLHEQNRYYLLTSQPQNLVKFSPFPDNAWVGVTATNYDYFVDACGILGSLKAKNGINVAFISLEPLLSWEDTDKFTQYWLQHGGIDWLIIGACTGNLKDIMNLPSLKPDEPRMMKWGKWTLQPRIEWVREIVEAADRAGIKVFLKDNLKPLIAQAIGSAEQKAGATLLRK